MSYSASTGQHRQGHRSDAFDPRIMKYVLRIMGLQNGITALIFGTVLLQKWDTFAVSPSYSVMAARASEATWGGIFIVIGIVQVFAHLLPFSWFWRIPPMILWLFVAFQFLVGDYRSTGWPNYMWDGIWAGVLFALDGAYSYRQWRGSRVR